MSEKFFPELPLQGEEISTERARAEVQSILNDIGRLGANDFEYSAIQVILEELNGKESLEERWHAITDARRILEGKQADH